MIVVLARNQLSLPPLKKSQGKHQANTKNCHSNEFNSIIPNSCTVKQDFQAFSSPHICSGLEKIKNADMFKEILKLRLLLLIGTCNGLFPTSTFSQNKILFVVSNQDYYGTTDIRTSNHFDEIVVPYFCL